MPRFDPWNNAWKMDWGDAAILWRLQRMDMAETRRRDFPSRGMSSGR
jgi:hypothetical protein